MSSKYDGGVYIAVWEIIVGAIAIIAGSLTQGKYSYGGTTEQDKILVVAGIIHIYFAVTLLIGSASRSVCLITTWLVYKYFGLIVGSLTYLERSVSSRAIQQGINFGHCATILCGFIITIVCIAAVHQEVKYIKSEQQSTDATLV